MENWMTDPGEKQHTLTIGLEMTEQTARTLLAELRAQPFSLPKTKLQEFHIFLIDSLQNELGMYHGA